MANITRHDPFSEMDDFFKGFFLRPVRMELADTPTLGQIKVDVSEDESTYRVHAEVPGAKKEDIKVAVDKGVLRIEGERKQEKEEKGKKFHRVERFYGSFLRTFTMPDNVDEAKIAAEVKDGILHVRLPKAEKAKAPAVEVKVS